MYHDLKEQNCFNRFSSLDKFADEYQPSKHHYNVTQSSTTYGKFTDRAKSMSVTQLKQIRQQREMQ